MRVKDQFICKECNHTFTTEIDYNSHLLFKHGSLRSVCSTNIDQKNYEARVAIEPRIKNAIRAWHIQTLHWLLREVCEYKIILQFKIARSTFNELVTEFDGRGYQNNFLRVAVENGFLEIIESSKKSI